MAGWAARCRLEPFVALGARIRRHRKLILAAIEHGLSNGRVESVNGSSPASPSDSPHPTPSSPWPCSTSADTDPPSPAEHDSQISQESLT